MTNFASLGVSPFLVQSLERMRISIPTPIQVGAIPPALEGHDILASAQTGTGKTIAYLMPLITHLQAHPQSGALVLCPTRELAAQVRDATQQLFDRKTPFDIALLIGGDPIAKQFAALRRRPQLIVGTPGRILDHIDRRTLRLQETGFLVLDEADRMLDMGFSQPLEEIVHELRKERQTLMFSATMPPSIMKLSQKYLTNPKQVSVGSSTQAAPQIKQETLQTKTADKFPSLLNALNTREGTVIVFVRTKFGAAQLAEKLRRQDHQADAIHGDLRQRQRDQVLKSFRNLESRILVATDVASRGLDIPHVKHVINYDLPECPEDYIHRIGRTGRAGMEGNALSFVSPEEGGKWRLIHKLMHPNAPQPDMGGSRDRPGQSRRRHNYNQNASRKPGSYKPQRKSPPRTESGSGSAPASRSRRFTAR